MTTSRLHSESHLSKFVDILGEISVPSGTFLNPSGN